ncbi:MAG: hypothetical protein JW839_09365 [Candidatus Lokiarchaeota archaeon]|nr:hypothetical protein [Candidatus Lokiarchaeota archaeon]
MPDLDVEITAAELQLLLNSISADNDKLWFDISFPLFNGFKLFQAKPEGLGYAVEVGNVDFNSIGTQIPQHADEFPTYQDFKECFLASGCMQYDNVADFLGRHKNYKDRNRRVFFSPDTNVLYHGFLSSRASFLAKERIPIAPTVHNEIQGAMNHKYDKATVDDIKARIRFNSELIKGWVNNRIKRSRKAAYLAMREKNRLITLKLAGIEGRPPSYAQKDLYILKELQQFMDESRSDVIYLTADRAAQDFCEMENVEYFLFKIPARVDVRSCTAAAFCELLFDLTAVFGVIRVHRTLLFCEFPSKTGLDQLKVRLATEKLHTQFAKDLKICRRLMEFKSRMPTKEVDF